MQIKAFMRTCTEFSNHQQFNIFHLSMQGKNSHQSLKSNVGHAQRMPDRSHSLWKCLCISNLNTLRLWNRNKQLDTDKLKYMLSCKNMLVSVN